MIIKPKLGQDERMIQGLGTMGTYTTALADNMRREPTPYLHRTAVGKGTVQTTLGGKVDFKDKTGGTSIITYDPASGSVTFGGLLKFNNVLTFGSSTIFNGGGTVNQGTLLFISNSGTPAVLSMKNKIGGEVIRLEAGTGNYGTFTASEYDFFSNLGNKIIENFGVVVTLADTGGFHAFWVKDSTGGGVWQFASNGQMKQLKSGDWQLQGNSGNVDPGGGPANSGKLYIKTVATKGQLCIQWPNGSVGTIASQP